MLGVPLLNGFQPTSNISVLVTLKDKRLGNLWAVGHLWNDPQLARQGGEMQSEGLFVSRLPFILPLFKTTSLN